MVFVTGSEDQHPILVTGMPRSGKTWVASMLEASGSVVHLPEPLNVNHPPGTRVLSVPVHHQFQYICAENEEQFLDAYRDLAGLRYHLLDELRANHAPSALPAVARGLVAALSGRLTGKRALVADPYAAFSCEWLARRLGFHVVVTVRHPAAVVSSHKRLGWGFRAEDLLDQPLLMRDWLEPFRPELERLVGSDDLIAQAALLWRMVYAAVTQLRGRVPELSVVRHEDLSLDPRRGFERIYDRLGLPFTPAAQRTIARSSDSQNPSEVALDWPHSVQLDSRANLDNWRQRLSRAEIDQVRGSTGDVASSFYTEDDWRL